MDSLLRLSLLFFFTCSVISLVHGGAPWKMLPNLVTDSIKKEMLDLHNKHRRDEGASDMNEVEWDDEIAQHSHEWASKCEFWHEYSPNLKTSKYSKQSQNLYATEGESNYYAAVDIWAAERGYYTYKTHTCQPNKPCGHYTLAVWSTVQKIGCAAVTCPVLKRSKGKRSYENAQYVVCQYWPSGNYEGKRPYSQGEPCSKCPNYKNFCKDGLCQPNCQSSDDPGCTCKAETACPWCQKRDAKTCKCLCADGFRGDNCQEICYDGDPMCTRGYRVPERFHKQACAQQPAMQKYCPAFCGKCKRATNQNWSCDGKTFSNFLSVFAKGAVKKSGCTFPYKALGKYFFDGQCFTLEDGKKYCSIHEDYDRYKKKKPCPF